MQLYVKGMQLLTYIQTMVDQLDIIVELHKTKYI